jgi:hypothetical protein
VPIQERFGFLFRIFPDIPTHRVPQGVTSAPTAIAIATAPAALIAPDEPEFSDNAQFQRRLARLFKDRTPALSRALSFQQLSNCRIASAFYVVAMATHPSVYFFALQELHLCSLHLSIAKSTSAYSSLIDAARHQALVPIPFLSSPLGAIRTLTSHLMGATFHEEPHNTTKQSSSVRRG